MRAPSAKRLTEAFRDLTPEDAKLIRKFAKAVDDPEELEELVEEVPATAAYVRQMHSSPYRSAMWRRTVALHAIDQLVEGHGVEALGDRYEYVNMGGTYDTTIIYDREQDRLTLESWGGIVESGYDPEGREDNPEGSATASSFKMQGGRWLMARYGLTKAEAARLLAHPRQGEIRDEVDAWCLDHGASSSSPLCRGKLLELLQDTCEDNPAIGRETKKQYVFPTREDAKAFVAWLKKYDGTRATIRQALPEFKHGGSPGVSVFFTPRSFGAMVDIAPQVRALGGRKWERSNNPQEREDNPLGNLPAKASRMWEHVYESAVERGLSKSAAARQAWCVVKRRYYKKGDRWRVRKDPLDKDEYPPGCAPYRGKRAANPAPTTTSASDLVRRLKF